MKRQTDKYVIEVNVYEKDEVGILKKIDNDYLHSNIIYFELLEEAKLAYDEIDNLMSRLIKILERTRDIFKGD